MLHGAGLVSEYFSFYFIIYVFVRLIAGNFFLILKKKGFRSDVSVILYWWFDASVFICHAVFQ